RTWRLAGRGWPNNRSHSSAPMPVTQLSPASGTRKPTERRSPLTLARNSRMASSWPRSTTSTRKIAEEVGCSRIDWGSGVGIADIVADRQPSPPRIDPPAMNASLLHAEPRAPPLLAVGGLNVSFGPFRALRDVDLRIAPGELV